jgi:hypothetical protein
VGEDGEVYEWQEGAEMPAPQEARTGWVHHGLVVNRSDEIIGFRTGSEVVILGKQGRALRSWPVPLKEGHGFTIVEEDGEEYLWIADLGGKQRRVASGAYEDDRAPEQGQVVRFD